MELAHPFAADSVRFTYSQGSVLNLVTEIGNLDLTVGEHRSRERDEVFVIPARPVHNGCERFRNKWCQASPGPDSVLHAGDWGISMFGG